MRLDWAHLTSASAMNSGPLSRRIDNRAPRTSTSSFKAWMTRAAGRPGVDLDAQTLAVEFVDDVEGSEALSGPQRIGHEVATPALVVLCSRLQWSLNASRQSLLAMPGQVQPHLAVHAPQYRLAPGLALIAGAVIQQAEAVAGAECHVRLHGGDDPGLVACRRPVTQRGSGNAAELEGSPLAHAVFGHQGLNDHHATLRGQSFRSTTSLSAWCMSVRSAYMRLSLAFSSCNWCSWDRCETVMPENWSFHLLYVASLMPCFLHVSLTFEPTSTF